MDAEARWPVGREARRDHSHDLRHVVLHDHGACRRRDDLADALGGAIDLGQPVAPRGDRLGAPQLEELADIVLRLRGYAAERVRDDVHALLERREQLAVLEQTLGYRIRHGVGLPRPE